MVISLEIAVSYCTMGLSCYYEIVEIIILGQTPAKKNSRRGAVRNGRIMNFPSKIYEAWHKDALIQLKTQYKGQAEGKVTIAYQFYVKDNRARDLDNMIASINDVLVDAGLIKDDSWQCVAIGAADAEYDKDNPRAVIWIGE